MSVVKILLVLFVSITCLLIKSFAQKPAGNDFSALQTDTVQDENKNYLISEITFFGNKITRKPIIYRELTFSKGDSISINKLKLQVIKSQENLMNTFLFNEARIEFAILSEKEIQIYVFFKERWYTWPVPLFEVIDRNFNEWWQTKKFSRTIYGGALVRNNFRGRNEVLQLALREGYAEKSSLYYAIPYIDKDQNVGITINAIYSRNHEIAFRTFSNKLEYYSDPNTMIRKEFAAGLRCTRRNGFYLNHAFSVDYKIDFITDTVAQMNPSYFLNQHTKQQYINFMYSFVDDHRDNKAYPLKGYVFDFEADKTGFFKNDIDLISLKSSIHHYLPLTKKLYFAWLLRSRITGHEPQPYFFQKALGYGTEYIRGYEYYVVDGQNYIMAKTNIKYSLLRPFNVRMKFIPFEKFNVVPVALYLNAFSDVGYVRDKYFYQNNPLANTFLIGGGIGLDYVSYYNIVLRFEYCINHLGEKGFFIHFTQPI